MDNPLTPQQVAFLKAYTDPKSETWGNYKQSALKAGYSAEYADNISSLMPDWLSENIGDTKLLRKANKNLDMALDGLLDDPEKGAKTIQHKATEFVLKGLEKKKWATQSNLADADGEKINFNVINYDRTTE
jgi:hypothetical protein